MAEFGIIDSFKLDGRLYFSRMLPSKSKKGIKGPYWYSQPVEANDKGKYPQRYIGKELKGKGLPDDIEAQRQKVEAVAVLAAGSEARLEVMLEAVKQFRRTGDSSLIEVVKKIGTELGLTEAQPEPQPDKAELNRLARERERAAISEAKSHLLSLDYESCPETIKGKWDSTAAVEILRERDWKFVAETDFQTGFWMLPGTLKRSEIGNMWREAYKMVRGYVLKSRQDQN